MASSRELIRKRSDYYAFKEFCYSLATKLSNTIDYFEDPIRAIKEAYTVNGEVGDYGYLIKQKSILSEQLSNINYRIIPNIDREISRLNVEIEEAIVRESSW